MRISNTSRILAIATIAATQVLIPSEAHAAGTVTQTVSSVSDRNGLRFDMATGSEFDDLNSIDEEDRVFIQAGDADPQANTTWWDASFVDLDSGVVFPGSRLTTVRLYVQYRMESGPWTGSGTLYAMTTSGDEIASRPLLHTTTTLMDSWYLTADVRSYAAANSLETHDVVNDLRIKVMNSNVNGLLVYWTYSALEVSYNLSPATPGVTQPVNSSTDVARMPDLESGLYSDRDSPEDAHYNTDWQIVDDVTFEVVAESLGDGTNLTAIAFDGMSLTGSLAASAALLPNRAYLAEVRHRDEVLSYSSWSSSAFTTGWGQPPLRPVLTSPGTNTSRTPTITTNVYSDPEGDAHQSTTWEIYEDNSGSRGPRVALITSGTELVSVVIDGGFENSLAGLLSLAPSTMYWATARHTDEHGLDSGWGDDVSFITGANAEPLQPVITSTGAATDHTPTITASTYSDPDSDAHIESDWRVFRDDLLLHEVVTLSNSTDLESTTLDSGFTVGEALADNSSLAPDTQYWAQVRYRDAYGSVSSWSDAFAFTTSANDGPATPIVTNPGSGVSRNPLITADAYSDTNDNAHGSSVWEIYEQASLSDLAVTLTDSDSAGDLTSVIIDASATYTGSHAGLASLAPETEFWLRVRYVDEHGGESLWSDAVSFTTQPNVPPLQPAIISPTEGAIDLARNVSISCLGYSDADGDEQGYSDWMIYDQVPNSGITPIAESLADADNKLSVITDARAFTFLDAYSGRANLDGDRTYWVVVIHYDVHGGASPESDPVSFSTNDIADSPDTPVFLYPLTGSAEIPLSPTITTAAYSDPSSDAHVRSDWQIFDNADVDNSDPIAYSTGDIANLTAITVDSDHMTLTGPLQEHGSLRLLTTYYVRVMFHDDMNDSSGWSTVVEFTTGNFAEGDDWPFFGGDCAVPSRNSSITSPAFALVLVLILCAVFRQHGSTI